MIHVWKASGELALATTEKLTVRALKLQLGFPRFRQRLCEAGSCSYLGDCAEVSGPIDITALLLPFQRSSEAEDRELIQAAAHGDLATTERLLNRPLDPNCVSVNEDDGEFHTPLGEACQEGHMEVVSMLVEANANVNGECGMYGQETTPLGLACERGALHMVELLLSHGAETGLCHYSVGHGSFQHPLVMAAHAGDLQIVSVLLAAGARPYGEALVEAALLDNAGIVAVLLGARADPFGPLGYRYRCSTPIAIAMAGGCSEIVKMMEESSHQPL
ncbi:unnamed protein product [Symbiodinium sp. CCMP2592]|nr:unnamed protein product [Symbiodinium sp. CCMP2592]